MYEFDVHGESVLNIEGVEEYMSSPLFLCGIEVADVQSEVCTAVLDEVSRISSHLLFF